MIAEVTLWGRSIGAVTMAADERTAAFQYEPAFARSGIELSLTVEPALDDAADSSAR